MSETFVPRFLAAGGRLLPDTRVRRLKRIRGRWHLAAASATSGRSLEITADTVFVACGAVQTPALLRRSGMTGQVGDTLRFHTMVKAAARFPEQVNFPGLPDPVHQVKQFDPRFSMGCSVSSPATLALTMVDHPQDLSELDRLFPFMGLYYAQTIGGRGRVRSLSGFSDPLVRVTFADAELRDLAEALRRLCECLFAAGAEAVYPGVAGFPVLRSASEVNCLPEVLPVDGANLSTLHLFSTCRMGQDRDRCITDSFGKVHGTEGLYIADASLLCGPTVVNPQGTVMAVAHRNALAFLGV